MHVVANDWLNYRPSRSLLLPLSEHMELRKQTAACDKLTSERPLPRTPLPSCPLISLPNGASRQKRK